MRILEVLLLAALLPTLFSLFMAKPARPRWLRCLPALGLVLLALHLLTEGYRWQMVPAYALTVLFLLSSARTLMREKAIAGSSPHTPSASPWRTAVRITGAVLGILAFILAALIPTVMPVFELPEPTGPFRVGTTRFSLVDSARPETFTADPSDRRELLIQAWYPAESIEKSSPEQLWGHPREIADRMTRSLGLPGFLFDHFELIPTHSHRGAALAGNRSTYPVLLFSHGYNQGIPPQNTVQMEELASHGYVVFSIGHSYESLVLIHADGRTVAVSEERMRQVRDELAGSGALIQQLLASRNSKERAELLRQVSEAGPLLNESLRVWVADTRFVLDELDGLDGPKELRELADRLDLARVGIFGMSFGGTAATEVCLTDTRCQAGINLDGLQIGASAQPGSALNVPFMFMSNESTSLMNEPVFGRAQDDVWLMTVAGSTHFNYSDFSLISPLFRKLGVLGSIDGARMEVILNTYIRAFFDRQLLDRESPLLNGASAEFPEVSIQKRARAAGN
ncbi:MAG: alpha/beta hydrolase family protein [Steroidobacteraceae bacterium]